MRRSGPRRPCSSARQAWASAPASASASASGLRRGVGHRRDGARRRLRHLGHGDRAAERALRREDARPRVHAPAERALARLRPSSRSSRPRTSGPLPCATTFPLAVVIVTVHGSADESRPWKRIGPPSAPLAVDRVELRQAGLARRASRARAAARRCGRRGTRSGPCRGGRRSRAASRPCRRGTSRCRPTCRRPCESGSTCAMSSRHASSRTSAVCSAAAGVARE